MTKYPYKYTITTKDGLIITNRMNAGRQVNASSQSMAKRILRFYYPKCNIIECKPKAKKHFDTSVGQFGSSIFLG